MIIHGCTYLLVYQAGSRNLVSVQNTSLTRLIFIARVNKMADAIQNALQVSML